MPHHRCLPVVVLVLGLNMSVLGTPAWTQEYGLTNRVANTTLTFPDEAPRPPSYTYGTENAFGNLTFVDPVVITAPPGETNQLFVVEQAGTIAMIPDLTAPTRQVFMNIAGRVQAGGEQGLLGLAFHPQYASNGYFYVFYTVYTNANQSSTRHDRLSRFQRDPANPQSGLPGSELILLNQRDEAGNHNAGDLHFGPDDYLYVALGDEGGGNDEYNNSQRIDRDYFAGVLRIDVDKRPGNLEPNKNHHAVVTNEDGSARYAVPADNPWVGATSFNGSPVNPDNVRTEFWAVGLRNPWRMSFDSETGLLYCGDVGQSAREEIDVLVQGGNYGWAFREGFIGGPKAAPSGAMAIDPILDYGRSEGQSVTGGVVYRGVKHPQLWGAYVFSDYLSGTVWSTFYDGTNATEKVPLTNKGGIAGFGHDPANGDILMADQFLDTIRRLVVVSSTPPFPDTLSKAGVFADLETLEPNPGIVPYSVNTPAWNDGALVQRWFSIPNVNQRMFFRADNNWIFPQGTVWLQHFEMEMTNGVPSSRRRLETRALVRINTSPLVYGVTYRWNEDETEALLVGEEGAEETLEIWDGTTSRQQVWRYPAQSDCLRCHTGAGGLALGVKTAQINRDYDYGGVVDNQLRSWEHAGYFQTFSPVANRHLLPAMVHPTNEAVSVEYRVRSYLEVNCAGCHVPGGPTSAEFDARLATPLAQTDLIDGMLNNQAGDPDNRVVAPGSIEHSMLLTRLNLSGAGRMPPVGPAQIDETGVALLSRWITNSLDGYQTFAQWQVANFGSTTNVDAQAGADPDMDEADNEAEYETGTDPTDPGDFWSPIGISRAESGVEVQYQGLANLAFEVQSAVDVDSPAWTPLNVPENAPFYAATNMVRTVPDTTTNAPAKIYRVRVRTR